MRTQNKQSQAELTPATALALLMQGNERFVNNLKANRNLLQQVNDTSDGQHPFAVILSCIDSRVSAELVFDQGLGDVFSVRIAGNFVNNDILGSMEYACKVAGAKLIMVLGHTRCGAVQSVCKDFKLGHVTGLLANLKPAVAATTRHGEDDATYADHVADTNVRLTVQAISDRSPILREMIEKGEIGICGGLYDVQSGAVAFNHTGEQVGGAAETEHVLDPVRR